MREIEVKVRVNNLEDVISRVRTKNIEVSTPVTQHDTVFGLPDQDGGGENTAPWLRIRTETRDGAARTLFTLKRSVTNQLDSIEHETEVADRSETAAIISELGFVPYSDITKTRQTAHINDMELCFDTVMTLGSYIEVEKITEKDADYDGVIAEIWQLLDTLGFSREDEVKEGYDVLINASLGK